MPLLKRATIKSYDAGSHRAAVGIAGSLSVWLADIRVADGIPAAAVVAGRECAVLFHSDDNPEDALIIAIAGAGAPVGDVGGPASSTNNALATWDGTGGDKLKNNILAIFDGFTLAVPAIDVGLGGNVAGLSYDDIAGLDALKVLDMVGLEDANPTGTPAAGEVGLFAQNGLLAERLNIGGSGLTLIPGAPPGLLLGRGSIGLGAPGPSSMETFGLLSGETEDGTVSVQSDPAAGYGPYVRYRAGAGTYAGIYGSGNRHRKTHANTFQAAIEIPDLANVRFFCGFSDTSLNNMLASDTPPNTATFFGIHYVAALNTNFRRAQCNGSGTVNFVNLLAGATVGNTRHHYRCSYGFVGSAFAFAFILDDNMSEEAFSGASTTNSPDTTDDLRWMCGIADRSGSASKDIYIYTIGLATEVGVT